MFIIQAVLYLAHGSRLKEGIIEARGFVNKLDKTNIPIQLLCFLEFAQPLVHEAIEQCVSRGVTRVVIMPLLLLKAGHAKDDLPLLIADAQRKFPQVTFVYEQPFGVHDAIISTLITRLQETGELTADSRVLIVGRGSSDPSIRADFEQIISSLRGRIHVSNIQVCFLARLNPTLDEGLQAELESGAKRIFILPYLLFTGLLMQYLEKKIKAIQSPKQTFLLCPPIGWSEPIAELIYQRIAEQLS